MNNNVNMAALNAMGGQVGGGMPMMNNGMPASQRQQQQQHNQLGISPETTKQQLNTYIYEYFLYNQMFDCARALIASNEPVNVYKNSPARRRDANGMDISGNSEDMEDTKEHFDPNRPEDLPAPNLPRECPEGCFLLDWWCLFWDMFNAQRSKEGNPTLKRYQENTQATSRMKQEHQQNILRSITQMGGPGGLMMRQQNGLPMGQNELARKAMQNNGGRMTQDQIRAMAQRQQHLQMQRGSSDIDGRQQGAQSPGSGEGAPSPSKRPRLDGAQFNGPMGLPNGRGQGGIPGQQHMAGGPGGNGPQNPMMLTNGMNSGSLAAQQFQNYPGQGGPNAANKAQMQQYTSQLAQHQQAQKAMVNPNGPQGQGSPMITQAPDGQQYYGGDIMINGGRPGAPAAGQGQTGSHALQDYQMQLMLLEQQNKKRLLMARQEQDSMSITRDGPPGPNGQPFPGTSPNGARSVNSPNPGEMMKRGTPQMAPGAIPSPEGQSRGSPASMNFMPQNMDPNQAPHFYKNPMNGMDMGMAGPNAMRQPPSSHPTAFNNGQMSQQQMINMQRHQQQQQQQQANVGQVPGWIAPNAAPMMQQQGSQQGSQSGPMGTPQQRAMPPPSVPAAAQAPNGRTQPSSPQQTPAPPTPSQTKKANPKAKKETKPKRKAGQTAATTGATPVGDAPEQPPTPTPQTPITPAHVMSFNPKTGQQNNGQGGGNNSQPAAPAVSQPPPISQPQAPDAQNGFQMDEFSMPMDGMDFAHPMAGGDVLQDFDFDSFLHQDSVEADTQFNFVSDFGLEGEVGAE